MEFPPPPPPRPFPPVCRAFKDSLGQKKLKLPLEDKIPHLNKKKYIHIFHNSAFIRLLISDSDLINR